MHKIGFRKLPREWAACLRSQRNSVLLWSGNQLQGCHECHSSIFHTNGCNGVHTLDSTAVRIPVWDQSKDRRLGTVRLVVGLARCPRVAAVGVVYTPWILIDLTQLL